MLKKIHSCLFLLLCGIGGSEKDELVSSHVIFRHGDRSPLWVYKNSPCPQDRYKDGSGFITKEGVERAYALGTFLRNRYTLEGLTRLISSDYTHKELNVLSSAVERAVQSGLAVVAGLFPPFNTSHEWSQLNWYPIPIRTAAENDTYFLAKYTNCTTLKQILNRIYQSPKIQQLFQEKKDFLHHLSFLAGSTINQHTLGPFYQTLVIERLRAMSRNPECGKTSEWANDEVMKMLEELTIQLHAILFDHTVHGLARLLIGPLLKFYLDHLKAIRDSSLTLPKLFLLSGHDTTLFSMMTGLGIPIEFLFPFSSSLLLEVYNRENRLEVELWYKDDPGSPTQPLSLNIPLCPYPCSIDVFIRSLESVASYDRQKECSSEP